LVGHDVDAELVAQCPFVEIAVVEIGADLRVVKPRWDDDAVRLAELRPGRVIGHFAEMPDLHALGLHALRSVGCHGRFSCAKRAIWSATASGCSICGLCAAPAIDSKRALGSDAASFSP